MPGSRTRLVPANPASERRRFAIGSLLGAGAFGEVYAASMTTPGGLSRQVAIKLLKEGVDRSSQPVRRLRDEGRMLANLHHPSILQVVDIISLGGRTALVTELVDGLDLHQCLREGMPAKPFAMAVAQIADALDASWLRAGVTHRDVKPSNIRVGRHGEVRLLDFGIAHTNQLAREANTATSMLMGSLRYMAPERFVEPETAPSADVFALGVVLFEGLSRARFYEKGTTPAALAQLALSESDYLAHCGARLDVLPELPSELGAMIEACLALEPDARPPASSVAAVLEDSWGALEGPSLASWCRGHSWPGIPERPGSWTGRDLLEDHEQHLRLELPDGEVVPMRSAPTIIEERQAVGWGAYLGLGALLAGGLFGATLVAGLLLSGVLLLGSEEPPELGALVASGAPVTLRTPDGVLPPGLVPPGRYAIEASFPNSLWQSEVMVAADKVVEIHCDSRSEHCRVVRQAD